MPQGSLYSGFRISWIYPGPSLVFLGSSFLLPCHLSLLIIFFQTIPRPFNVRSVSRIMSVLHPNSDGMYFFPIVRRLPSLNSMISRSSKRCPSATPSFSHFLVPDKAQKLPSVKKVQILPHCPNPTVFSPDEVLFFPAPAETLCCQINRLLSLSPAHLHHLWLR